VSCGLAENTPFLTVAETLTMFVSWLQAYRAFGYFRSAKVATVAFNRLAFKTYQLFGTVWFNSYGACCFIWFEAKFD